MVTLRPRASNDAWKQPQQWSPSSAAPRGEEDDDLARAIAASLGDSAGAHPRSLSQPGCYCPCKIVVAPQQPAVILLTELVDGRDKLRAPGHRRHQPGR